MIRRRSFRFRNAASLHLPPVETEEVTVTLSPEETAVYEGILADCQTEFDRMVSTNSEIKKYNILFATIMKLRRLYNHGTLQATTPSWPAPSGKRQRSRKQQISTDGELSCELCGGEDEDTATLIDSLDMCPDCSRCLGSQKAPLPQPPMNGLPPGSPPSSLAPWAPASRSFTPACFTNAS
ncbi:hypothetical protein GQ44DRAFT_832024 [Phaeosphaeriaceae sp. PMI808]|nr:hypothetical protein GQ44DRAFT_832024 [Phaeosphaeriaceae sp. PMI808]